MNLREGRTHCPAHEDASPSLDIRRGRDGRWLLCCRAGCQTRDILKAAGLTWSDLFSESTRLESPTRPPESPLVAARREVLAEARRQPWNRPGFRLRNLAADQLREAERFQASHRAETDDPQVWDALTAAAHLASGAEALWSDSEWLG